MNNDKIVSNLHIYFFITYLELFHIKRGNLFIDTKYDFKFVK